MHTLMPGRTLILLAGDFAVFAGSLFVTLLVRYQEMPSEAIFDAHIRPFSYLFLLWMLVFFIAGLYDKHITLTRKRIPALVFRIQFVNVLIAALYFFVLPFGIEPKTNLAIYLVVSSALVALWRLFVFPRIIADRSSHALVIGRSDEAHAVARVLTESPYFAYLKVFILDSAEYESAEELQGSLLRFVESRDVEMIVADLHDPRTKELVSVFYNLTFLEQNVRFSSVEKLYEELHGRIPLSQIGELWFLENVTTRSPHYAYDFLKRAIDLIGSLILLVPCAVIFPILAAAIWLEDRQNIFYATERIGRYNRPFRILKFRTKNGTDTGEAVLKSVLVDTKVGRFLRRTRLDELPQLFNVLKGDLSFIGPRPELPALASVYAEEIPYYNARHFIKPGLSGWAQINNFDVPRGGIDVPRTIDKLSYDLYYLKHRSLALDIEIALKTIKTVLLRTGT